MSVKFPKRRSNNWVPFVKNHTLIAAISVIFVVQSIHNLLIELVLGGGLVILNALPYHHYVASEWVLIWTKKRWGKLQGFLPWGTKKVTTSNDESSNDELVLASLGTASIVSVRLTTESMSKNSAVLWFNGSPSQNSMGWIGVWKIPATSHLALAAEPDQKAVFSSWGRLLVALNQNAVARIEMLQNTIVTTSTGPLNTLRQMTEVHPDLDPDLVKRYNEVATMVGSQVHDRNSYLAIELKGLSRNQKSEMVQVIEHLDRIIKGHVKNAELLSPDELRELIAGAINPEMTFLRMLLGFASHSDIKSLNPVPYHLQSDINHLRLPYHLSRSYVISEFPLLEVDDTWQLSLLGSIPPKVARYSIAYTFHPSDPQTALHDAERQANKTEMEILSRASGRGNQRIMSREHEEIQSAQQTERDLTTGEAMLKGIGIITITVESEPSLEEAETWLLRQAGTAFLKLRRLDWRHDEGWLATLPLCVMPIQLETHIMSTKQAQSLFQAQIGSPLPVPGILLGRDKFSGAPFSWDAFELYASHIISSPTAIVLGQVGTGKSTLSKLLALRGMGVHKYGFFALDPKGEYTDTAKELGIPYHKLVPHVTPINPLDLDSVSAKASMLGILATSVIGRSLEPQEASALDALAGLLPPGATLSTAINLLRFLPDEVVYAMAAQTKDSANQQLQQVIAGLQRYTGAGKLGGLFDGNKSFDIDPKGMIVNLAGVFTDELFKPVSQVVAFWLKNAITNLDQRSFLIVDEGWAILDSMAAFLQSTTKLSRSYGVSLILTMHGLSDVAGSANAGTATQGKLQTILEAAQSAFIFSNTSSEMKLIAENFTLSRTEQAILNLDEGRSDAKGMFLAVIGGNHFLCETVLARGDIETTNTDQNMSSTLMDARMSAKDEDFVVSAKIFDDWVAN